MDLENQKEIIAKANKDPERFGELYDEYYSKILGYCLKRTANIQIAEDLTSEVFFKALNKLWQFRWRNISFSSWLYKIATNEINDYYKEKYRPSISLDYLQERIGYDVPTEDNSQRDLIDKEIQNEKQLAYYKIIRYLKDLPIKYQEVITLKYFEYKKISEISEILGKKEGTIKSLLSRGIDMLQRKMQENSISAQPFVEKPVID
jgi:RNA polymerase sigma-70 factor (ECF subfamily)